MTEPPDRSGATDGELMRLSQANDADAFEELYDRYSAPAYQVACAVCRDQRRAEDAVRDGFLSIWRRRSAYRAQAGSFKSWLMSAVQDSAIELNRRESTAARRKDQALAHIGADTLRASLERIPGAQAEVIALAYYGELSHTEIAQQLGLPEGTVKGRMRLGLEKLRRQMRA